MLYGFLISIHIFVSIVLVVVILLQSNTGGGAGGVFGGGSFQNMFGIKSPSVMAKFTAVCATVFILTSVSLALLSARKSGSIVERSMHSQKAATSQALPVTSPQASTHTSTTTTPAATPSTTETTQAAAQAPSQDTATATATAPAQETKVK